VDPTLNDFLASANASLATGQSGLEAAQNNLNRVAGISTGSKWPLILGAIGVALGIYVLAKKG